MRRPYRRGKAQKSAVAFRNTLSSVAPRGKQLDLTFLQAKVAGCCVREEFVAMGNDAVVQLVHIALVFLGLRWAVAIDQRPASGPFHAPFQRAYDTVSIAGGQSRLPRIHPLFVKVA